MYELPSFSEMIQEDLELDESTIKRVTRFRGGKLQRRKVVAAKSGYKTVGGKAVRMKASERLNRKRASIKGARKRKGKKAQIQRSRKKTMRKRQARGL